jgi:hypothetical protein
MQQITAFFFILQIWYTEAGCLSLIQIIEENFLNCMDYAKSNMKIICNGEL